MIMKKILYFFYLSLCLLSCDSNDYEITEEYEKAAISAIECYNVNGERADKTTEIATPTRMVIVKLKKGEDIKNLKVCLTISSGATVTPVLSVGYQDFSEPKTYQVTSPGGSVVNEWVLRVYETL